MNYMMQIAFLIGTIIIILFSFKKGNKFTISKHYYWLGLLIGILLITRLYRLGEIPLGINVDEAGILYDAHSLANYGVDRYGISWPIYLQNFGHGMSSLYTFLATLANYQRIDLTATRLIMVIFSLVNGIFVYLLGLKKNKDFALILLFLYTVTPYFIMSSRWSLDCNLLLPMTTISIYCLTLAIQKQKIQLFALTGFILGITLYTYALSYLMLPIFLLLTLIYLIKLKKVNIQQVLALSLPLFVLAIPLIAFILVNNDLLAEFKLFNTFSVFKISNYRQSEISFHNILKNYNVIKTYFFGQGFYFNVIKDFSTLYYLSIPLVLFGTWLGFKNIFKRAFDGSQLVIFFLISNICLSLLIAWPNVSKSNSVYFSLIYLIALALSYLLKNNRLSLLIIVVYFISFMGFSKFYYFEYGKQSPQYFEDDIVKIVQLNEQLNPNKNTFLDVNHINQPGIYVMIALDLKYDQSWSNEEVANYDLVYDNIDHYDCFIIQNNQNHWLEDYLKTNYKAERTAYNYTIYSKN